MKNKIFALLMVSLLLIAGCSKSDSKADMSGYDLLTVKDHNFVTGNYSELLTQLKNKEPGIYYFGFDTCPWCRELVPVLQSALENANTSAYYFNVRGDAWKLDVSQSFDEYNKSLPTEQQTTGFPFVVFVGKDGTITTHVGTLPSHDAYQREMTSDERAYLLRILNETISEHGLSK